VEQLDLSHPPRARLADQATNPREIDTSATYARRATPSGRLDVTRRARVRARRSACAFHAKQQRGGARDGSAVEAAKRRGRQQRGVRIAPPASPYAAPEVDRGRAQQAARPLQAGGPRF
jgi:hypothetical protein